MKNLKHKFIILKKVLMILSLTGLIFISTLNLKAQQYNIAGTAVAMTTPGCYRLTNTTSQAGAVWNIFKINLNLPFDITLSLNFGNRNVIHYVPATCGADGMSFVLQPLSAGVFGAGSGVGFHGINPSVGVVMDTYVDNPTDPTYQHISINKNGDELHATANELVPPTSAVGFPANITDGLDHLFRFTWIPTGLGNGTINVYFGTSTVLPLTPTMTYTGNIVNTIFAGDPHVYWGVSGSTGGCWNVQSVCMTTVSNFLSDTTICEGSPVGFTNNSISGLPITNYSWNFGDGDTSNLQSPTHIYTAAGTYNVTLYIMNSGGFSSTMTHSIVVNPLPNININDTSICFGDTAVLNASGATYYQWNNGLSPFAIQNVAPLTTTTYTVKGTSNHGCIKRDTAIVTVYPKPVISLTPDTSICKGDSIKLQASGAVSYLWSTSQTSSSIFVSPVINTLYYLAATDNLGCTLDTTVNVKIYTDPQVSFNVIPYPAEGCAPVSVSFSDQSSPLMQSWLWNFGDGNTSTVQNPTHNYITAGDFDVSLKVVTTDGCKGDLTVPAFVKVFDDPVAAFITNGLQFSLSNPVVNFNSTNSSPSVNSWHWNFGDPVLEDDSSNIQNPTYIYQNQGVFPVWLFVKTIHGCSDSTSLFITVVKDSLVFPNFITPNGDGLNDFLDIQNLENLLSNVLSVYNRWGKKVYQKENYIPKVDRWDGNGLADGTYYYILTYKGILKNGEYKSSLTIMR